MNMGLQAHEGGAGSSGRDSCICKGTDVDKNSVWVHNKMVIG